MKLACVPIIYIQRARNTERTEIMRRHETSSVINIGRGLPPERDRITSKKPTPPLKAEIFSARLRKKNVIVTGLIITNSLKRV